jgi:hypothetical protein
MPAKINLLNQKFGKLLVIEETNKRKNKSIVWKCQCDCGNIEEFSTKELRSDGLIQCHQCGNKRNPKTNLLENIIGNKYNHLTVLEKSNKYSGGKILYKCQCDCEKQKIVYVSRTDLISGHTKSCGCNKLKYHIGDIINNREIIGFDTEKDRFYYKCKCLFCGREYSSLAYNLQKTISCGCQKSIGEYNIIQILKNNNIPYIKEYCFPKSLLRFDFALLNKNNKIIRLIEFDGEQHYLENIKNSGWNTYEKYEYTLQNDLEKNKIAKNNNIPLIRIPYWERDNITLSMLMSNKYLIE